MVSYNSFFIFSIFQSCPISKNFSSRILLPHKLLCIFLKEFQGNFWSKVVWTFLKLVLQHFKVMATYTVILCRSVLVTFGTCLWTDTLKVDLHKTIIWHFSDPAYVICLVQNILVNQNICIVTYTIFRSSLNSGEFSKIAANTCSWIQRLNILEMQ